MKRLRVGYYVSTTFTGGMERHVLTLIDNLNPEKCDIVVFCASSQWLAPFFAELKERRVRLYTTNREQGRSDIPENQGFRGVWMRGLQWLLRWLSPEESAAQVSTEISWILSIHAKLAEAKLDVIHFHAGRLIPLYWPLIASRLVGIPTRILTFHNAAKKRSPIIRAIHRIALGTLDCVVTPSVYIKETLLADKRASAQKVVVIPHGIELPAVDGAAAKIEARMDLQLPADAPVVGTVGRLVDLKGYDVLIGTALTLRERVPGIKIVLIGKGPEENALRKLAIERGVTDVVVFAGYRRNAARLIPAFDIFVAPSRDEGFSLSIVEAMAHGKPVVAANIGGIPEIVVDRVTGILAAPKNPLALAEAIIELLTNPHEGEKMGRAGRDRIGTLFLLETMLSKTFALYHTRPGSRFGPGPTGTISA